MAHVAYAAPPGGFRRGEREEEDWSDNIMLDRRVLELVLISLLAVFGTGLAWALDHKLFATAFAGAAIFAGYAARSLAVKR